MNKMISQIFSLAIVVSIATSCSQSEPPDAAPGADTVYRNGKVYTVDAGRSWAEAVAITDGRITYVGSDAAADQHIGSNTTVVDLGGRNTERLWATEIENPAVTGLGHRARQHQNAP